MMRESGFNGARQLRLKVANKRLPFSTLPFIWSFDVQVYETSHNLHVQMHGLPLGWIPV